MVKSWDYCKYECIDGFKMVQNSWDPDRYNVNKGTYCLWGEFDFFAGDWDPADLPECEAITSLGILCDNAPCGEIII